MNLIQFPSLLGQASVAMLALSGTGMGDEGGRMGRGIVGDVCMEGERCEIHSRIAKAAETRALAPIMFAICVEFDDKSQEAAV